MIRDSETVFKFYNEQLQTFPILSSESSDDKYSGNGRLWLPTIKYFIFDQFNQFNEEEKLADFMKASPHSS